MSLKALGFWASHPEVMDLVAEEDAQLHEELESIRSDQQFTSIIYEIVELAEQEVMQLEDRFLAAIDEQAKASSLERSGCRNRWNVWGRAARFAPRDGRLARNTRRILELGWTWQTIGNQLHLEPWVWMRGGRAQERRLHEVVRNGSTTPTMAVELQNYSSGAVRLGTINVSSLVSEGFSIDASDLVGRFAAHYDWLSWGSAKKLFGI